MHVRAFSPVYRFALFTGSFWSCHYRPVNRDIDCTWYWIIGILDYWIIGLLDYWIIGFLKKNQNAPRPSEWFIELLVVEMWRGSDVV